METVDGQDADAVAALTVDILARVRKGRPVFLEARIERWPGSHQTKPDFITGVTDVSQAWDGSKIGGEHADWIRQFDPILLYAKTLLGDGTLQQDDVSAIDARVNGQMAEARAYAEASPYPDPASVLAAAFAQEVAPHA